MMSDAPTAYALALTFDLVTDEERPGAARAAPGGARPGRRLSHRDRVRRHTAGHRRAVRRRLPGRSRPAAAADREPLLAVPGHDGRDDDLGALGQPARGRLGQPGRDDLVQPLRPRRRRRLAASHRGRARSRRTRVPPHPHRPATAPRARARGGEARYAVRSGIRRMAARRIVDRRERRGAAQHHGGRRPARARAVRGRLGQSPSGGRATVRRGPSQGRSISTRRPHPSSTTPGPTAP